jgi:hypothetical protein
MKLSVDAEAEDPPLYFGTVSGWVNLPCQTFKPTKKTVTVGDKVLVRTLKNQIVSFTSNFIFYIENL